MNYYEYKKLVEEIFQITDIPNIKQSKIDSFNKYQWKYLQNSQQLLITRLIEYKNRAKELNLEEKRLGKLLIEQPNIIFLSIEQSIDKIKNVCNYFNKNNQIVLEYNKFLKSIIYNAHSILHNSSFEIIQTIEELYKTLSNHVKVSYFCDKHYNSLMISKNDFLKYLNHNAHILISPLTHNDKEKFICYILETTYPTCKNNQVLHLEYCQEQQTRNPEFQNYKCPFERQTENTFQNIKIEKTWGNSENIFKTLISKIKNLQH